MRRNYPMRSFLAVSCYQTKDFHGALKEMDICISLGDSSLCAAEYINKAYILLELNEYKAALETSLKVNNMIESDIEVMKMIARWYFKLKEYKKCLYWVEEVLKINACDEKAAVL